MNKALEALKQIRRLLVKPYQYLADDIEKALTPPTVDEVCEAINSYWGTSTIATVKYDKEINEFYFTTKSGGPFYMVERHGDQIEINGALPPHLITMISRFYEGLKEDE